MRMNKSIPMALFCLAVTSCAAFGQAAPKAPVRVAAVKLAAAAPPTHPSPYKSPILKRIWEKKGLRSHARQLVLDSPQLNLPFLTTPPMYAAGSNETATDLALGDFNGDNKLDIIVAANPPVILLGNGDGTFQAAVSIGTITSNPTGVAVADFNGDGKPDAAFAISGAAEVYLGNGNGTFGSGTTFASSGTNEFPRILAEDVNNDGFMDLILNTDSGVNVLLGNGNGTFQPAKPSSADVQFMAAADFNKDGQIDLAVTDGFESLSILLGKGDGTFTVASTYSIPSHDMYTLAAADYNGDTIPDVALPNGQVYLGNGDGTLQSPGTFPTAPDADVVGAADVNGDGILDLLTSSLSFSCGAADFGLTGVSLGKGDGTFQPITVLDSGGCTSPAFIVSGDLNNDGMTDLLVLIGSPGYSLAISDLSVLVNSEKGTFPAAQLEISGGSNGIAVNDFTRDGNDDAVLADGSVYLGGGDGTLHYEGTAALGGIEVTTGDFNHDGNPDVAAAVECAAMVCGDGGQLSFALGNGNGTFRPPRTLPSGGFYAESLAVADFNGDGNLDIGLVNNCIDSSCSSAAGSVSIYLGNGAGGFTLLSTTTLSFFNPTSVVTGDFNNDGIIDLSVSGLEGLFEPGIVTVLLGNGDGSFQAPIVTDSTDNNGISAAATGDFNNDGILDLVVANGDTCSDCGGEGNLMYGNGDGTFTAGPSIETNGGPPASVVAADFFGTGTAAPALANRCGDTLDCPEGSIFVYGAESQSDIMLLYLAVGDFNNDGKPDVAGSLQFDSGATILLNTGATLAASTTTLSPAGLQTYSAFQSVTFTARVSHTGLLVPTGEVDFLDNGVSIGSASLGPNGQALIRTKTLAVGSHFVVAYYRGDTNFAPSNSPGARVTIVRANTRTILTSSPNPSQPGQKVTFTAVVTGQYGGPTGTVTFKAGNAILKRVTLTHGSASLSTNKLSEGNHRISADYSGNSQFQPSSDALTQIVK